jgi:hypothetical protein
VLASARNLDLVRIVLARGYCVRLAGRIYTDDLDHKITILILVVSAIREVLVSLIQNQPNVKVAICFLYDSVYCSGSNSARFYDLKPVGMIDMAADGCGVAAA